VEVLNISGLFFWAKSTLSHSQKLEETQSNSSPAFLWLNKWLTLCANSNGAEAIFLTVISNIYLVTVNRQVGQVGERAMQDMEKCLENCSQWRPFHSFLSFFSYLTLCTQVRRVWKILLKGEQRKWEGGGGRRSENGKCLSAFYVVAHFSLTKLNDWLSVPFRMVSGSKNPHSGQPTTGKMPHATCHMQHVSAAPLNCISLPNTSIITPKKK